MPESTQNLVFKLIIDGKEAVATLDVVKGEFVVTGEAAEQMNQDMVNAYKGLISEALKYNTVSEQSVKGLQEYISAQNLSVNVIEDSIRSLQEEATAHGINSQETQRATAASINLKAALGSLLEQKAASINIDETASKAQQLLTTEALKHNTVTESSVMLLAQYIGSQNLTTESIQNVIRQLEQEAGTLGMNTEAWKLKMAAAANLRGAMQSMTQQTTGMNMGFQAGVPGVNSMRMAMTQFGYSLNDAQMFMVNARMGLMGISNNIPMIVQSFNDARASAARLGTSISTQLTAALMGGGGLIIGINALLLLINVLPALFGESAKEGDNLGSTLDELTKTSNKLGDGFSNVKKAIGSLNFQELSEKYDDLILAINESEGKLNKSGLWSQIWQGLTFKPLTQMLGYTMPWQDAFEGKDSDTADKLDQQERAKAQIEAIGTTIKTYLDSGYSVKDLLNIPPSQRDKVSGYLDGMLNDWAENIKTKDLSIGNKLRGEFFELGTYSRDQVEKLKKTIDELDKPDRSGNKLIEEKKRLVEQYFKEEIKKNLEKEITNKDYIGKLEELEAAEHQHQTAIDKIKNAKDEKSLKSAALEADIAEIKIKVITEAIEKEEKLNSEEMEDWRKKRDEILKYQQKMLDDREKFEKEKEKFKEDVKDKTTTNPEQKLLDDEKRDLDTLDFFYDEAGKKTKEYEELRYSIIAYYSGLRKQLHMQEAEEFINIIADAYNNVFNLISSNVRDEIDEWKNSEEEKIEAGRKSALSHARTEAQRDKINEQYDKKKDALDKEADKKAKERLEGWFNLQKAVSIAQAIISTYQAAAGQLAMQPVGPWNIALAAAITAAGLANVAVIAAQKMPKGFREGGILPKGKAGFVEGEDVELIAPEKTFKEVMRGYRQEASMQAGAGSMQNQIGAEMVKRALVDYKNYVTVSGGGGVELKNIERELTGLKSTINELNNVLKEGIDARAVYDEDAAERIYLKGRGCYRRSKI